MVAKAKPHVLDRIFSTPRHRYEMIVIERVCTNPQQFPVHILADDHAFELIKQQRAASNRWWYVEPIVYLSLVLGS